MDCGSNGRGFDPHRSPQLVIIMAIERTLSIIKPDAVSRDQTEAISQQLQSHGFKVIAAKYHQLTRAEAEQFYAEHNGKDFFEGCIQFITSGKIFLQVLERDNAIKAYRKLMGATDPKQADPDTLRAQFGAKALPANAVHGSDSQAGASREITLFFKDLALSP